MRLISSKQLKRLLTYIIGLIIVSTLSLAGVIMTHRSRSQYTTNFEVDIGTRYDTDSKKSFFLQDMTEEGRISNPITFEDETVRRVLGSPIYFYLDISEINKIARDRSSIFSLKFKTDSDLEYGLLDKNNDISWKPFFSYKLLNYKLVKNFNSNHNIYKKKEVETNTNDNSLKGWLNKGLKKNDTVEILDKDFNFKPLLKSDMDLSGDQGKVNFTNLKGSNKFVGYFEDNIEISLDASLLGPIDMEDPLEIEIYDLEGSRVSHTNHSIEWDEEVNITKINLQVSNNKVGIFHIYINANSKLIFPNISFNSKQIIVKDKINKYSEEWDTMYVRIINKEHFYNNIGHEEAVRIFSLENEQLKNPANWHNNTEEIYKIETIGEVSLRAYSFSVLNNNFNPYRVYVTNIDPDFIIGKYHQEITDGWVTIHKHIQGQEFLEHIRDGKITIGIRSSSIKSDYEVAEYFIKTRQFNKTYEGYNSLLYSDKELISNKSGEDIEKLININYPANSNIYIHDPKELVSYSYFLKDFDDTELDIEDIESNYEIQGNWGMYLLTKGDLHLNWWGIDQNGIQGKDSIQIRVNNITNDQQKIYYFEDDGILDKKETKISKLESLTFRATGNNVFFIEFIGSADIITKGLKFEAARYSYYGNINLLKPAPYYKAEDHRKFYYFSRNKEKYLYPWKFYLVENIKEADIGLVSYKNTLLLDKANFTYTYE